MGEPIVYNPNQHWLLAFEGAALLGFLVFEEGEKQNKINYLYTYPELRQVGVASELLKAYLFHHPDQLTKAVTTQVGLKFFTKHGFIVTKSFTNYYKIEKR